MTVPLGFATWVDDSNLVTDFAELLAQWQREERHGDFLTHFAVEHDAPASVLDSIQLFIEYMESLYGR